MARDPLTTATIDAIRTLWDPTNPLLGTDTIYARLESEGQITRPQSIADILERLDRNGVITFSRSGPLNAEGIALHGGNLIKDVNPAILDD